jgi:mono/diheme cytochrome c family protein
MSHTLPPDAAAVPAPGQIYGLLAEYDGVIPLLEAATRVRDAGYTCWDTYTPIPIHGLDEAMGIRRTRLPWVVFGAGTTGALLGLLMQWWMNGFNYPYVVSGKPLLGLPPFIPIIFEVTVLFSAITTLIAMLVFNKLPQLYHGWFSSRAFASRVTTDRFFLGIEARDAKFDSGRTRALLESTRSIGVETIEEAGSAAIPQTLRRYAVPGLVVLVAIAIVPPLLIAKARVTPSDNTQVLLIPDMVRQPKFLPQSFNPLFLDNRAMRPMVAGTVAVDHAYLDNSMYRGIAEGEWASGFPLPLTQGLVERGQSRFNIYCTPCHGWDGLGQGPVAVQGQARSPETWLPPTSLVDPTVRERPNGHIFNTITNGIRTMPAYGDQIPPADRWAILSYVRSLQLSQAAPKALVPAERRGELR